MSTQTRKQGFTLIELMIVVAVIGILAAALVPNLLGARQQAVQAQVEACARSIQTAQTVYVGDTGNYAQTEAQLGELQAENSVYASFLACDDTVAIEVPQDPPTNGYRLELTHANLDDPVIVTEAQVNPDQTDANQN